MSIVENLERLRTGGVSGYAERVLAELEYGARLSATQGGRFDEEVNAAAAFLLRAKTADGTLTEAAAREAEALLLPLRDTCKKTRVHCVAHAHIDMNWMWGYQETAGLTVDTFRTVLQLMDEYPDFTYSQSQASVYRILEEIAPQLLPDIRKRVAEGRWEVAASTWVETDKNMPSGESLARHILYTKRYLAQLLGVERDALTLDFEPDTFGHSANVPEICNAGGVRYYYHCRGQQTHAAYVWEAKSGARLLVYCEPDWYNAEIHPNMLRFVPEFTAQYGLPSVLKVYGVGDHGGGPTRRDIERLRDMATWPIMPEIVFSSYGRFFKELETCMETLPVKRGEQNFIFTGCYTTQSRIKMANRTAEARLAQAEALSAGARLFGGEYSAGEFTRAWEPVLFNQFHDILPGSGVIDTREYAMGIFQKSLALTNAVANRAMQQLAAAIDTSALPRDDDRSATAEGAGVGFRQEYKEQYVFPQAERGRGKVRLVTLFNTAAHPFEGVAAFSVWDWPGNPARLAVHTAAGDDVPAEVLRQGEHYWGHKHTDLLVRVTLPAMGYGTFVVYEKEAVFPPFAFLDHGRTHEAFTDAPLTLENAHVRAVFDKQTMRLLSYTDQHTGRALAAPGAAAFRLSLENSARGMTAWTVGDYMQTTCLNDAYPVKITRTRFGALRQEITYTCAFGRSSLAVSVRLDADAPGLEFQIEADWHETGNRETGIPQLSFAVPLGVEETEFLNDIPMGLTVRPPLAHDVPCNSFSAALHAGTAVTADTKYGFRNTAGEIAVTLIRAAFDPDPYPEYGKHHIRIGVFPYGGDPVTTAQHAARFTQPVHAVSNTVHSGALPAYGSLFSLRGEGILLSAVKTPEDEKPGIVVRLYNTADTENEALLCFTQRITAAYTTDITESHEQPAAHREREIRVPIAPGGICTLRVELQGL